MIKVDEARVCLQTAEKYWRSQQWQATIQTCAKALALDRRLAKAQKLMGDALQKIGKIDEAIGYYLEAIAIEPDFAEAYANLGTLCAQQKQWQQAIDYYQQALEIKPDFAGVQRHLVKCQQQSIAAERSPSQQQDAPKFLQQGRVLKQQGELQAALQEYLQAVRLAPQSVQIYRELIEVCEGLGLWSQAAQYCRKILELNNSKTQISAVQQPQHHEVTVTAENLYNIANLYDRQQQWSLAIQYYQRAIAEQPDLAKAHLNLARVLERSGDCEAAIESWLQAISLDPAAIEAKDYLAVARSLIGQQKLDLAVTYYGRAIKQQPLLDAYLELGELFTKSRSGEKAIAVYQQGLKHHSDCFELYFRLGNLYKLGQQLPQAVICYQKAIQRGLGGVPHERLYQEAIQYDARHAVAHHELGEVLSQQQRWSEAATAYRQAIELNPNFSWSYNNLGYALIQLEQWSEAVSVYLKAIEFNPDFSWSYYNLAEAFGKLEQWEEAVSLYQQTIQIQPDLPQVQQKLGDALYQRSQRDRQQALQHFLQAIAQDPHNVRAYHQALAIDRHNIDLYLKLGDLLAQQGESEQALVTYQMALQIQPKNSEVLARTQDLIGSNDTVPTTASEQLDFETLAIELNQILPHSDTPEISIIIPVYNQLEYTLKCLKAIALNLDNSTLVEVIVVNDCSSDRTKEILETVTPLKLVNSNGNQGFIYSCNQGASLAKGKYLYFLNNDTEIKPNCIESLAEVLAADNVGAVGSKLVYPQGSLQEAGGIVWQDASGWNYGRQSNPHAPEYNYLRSVDYCSGASLMVKREVFASLNGFERDFAPAYYEDTDLCFAIRHQLGLSVMYQPKSEVIHYEGISSGTSTTSGTKKYQVVNAVKFKHKWQSVLEQADYFPNQGIESVPLAARKYSGDKTILVIDSYMPSYDKESGSRRLFELLKIFKALNYHVIFAADNGFKDEPYTSVLQNLQIEVLYTQQGYGTSIEEQIGDRLSLIDVAWICRPELNEKYAPIIRQRPQIKVVYDTIDLHYLRLKRAWDLNPDCSTAAEWVDMQAKELKMAHQADLTITVTPTESTLLESQGISNVAVVPNIHTAYSDSVPSFEQRSGILFIGSYNHTPNIDAVVWLCREIMPLVWQNDPDIKVTLLGNNPSAEVLALESDYITVTGYIDDVTPYFLSHKLSVSPLRYGAGMKGKIGHSLEYKLPVVSTQIGTEGMNLIPEQHILEANTATEFASAILRAYNDIVLWNYLSSNATEAIASYTSDALKNKLHQTLENLFASS